MKTKQLLAILASFLLTAFPAVAQMITGQIVPSRELTKATQVEALASEKGKAILASPAVHPAGIGNLATTTFTFRAEITRKGVIIHEMWPVKTVAEMEACIIVRDQKATADTEAKTISEAQATGEVKPPRAEIVFDDEPVAAVTTTPATLPIQERASYPEITNLPKPEVKNLPAKLEVNLIKMVDAFEKEDTQPAPVPTPVAKPVEQPAAPAVIKINSVSAPVVTKVDSTTYKVDPLYTYGQDNKLEALEKRLPPFDYSIASAKPAEGNMWEFFVDRQNWINGIPVVKVVPAPHALDLGEFGWNFDVQSFAFNLIAGIACGLLLGVAVIAYDESQEKKRANANRSKAKAKLPTLAQLTQSGQGAGKLEIITDPLELIGKIIPIVPMVYSKQIGKIEVLPFVLDHGDTSRLLRKDQMEEGLKGEESETRATCRPFKRRGKFKLTPLSRHHSKDNFAY